MTVVVCILIEAIRPANFVIILFRSNILFAVFKLPSHSNVKTYKIESILNSCYKQIIALLLNLIFTSPFSEGNNRDAFSILVERLKSRVDQHSCECASVQETFCSNVVSDFKPQGNCYEYRLLLNLFYTKMSRDRNEMYDETQEFNDYKRQLSSSEAARTKTSKNCP